MDWRNIRSGWEIPSEYYSDQPYLVKTDDGAWLCQVTTGPGEEGRPGQHIIAMRSEDQGKTWSAPIDIEPSGGPEASYGVLAKAPGGRIFCFYNYNEDNIRYVIDGNPASKNGQCHRVDMLGHFVFKYSDDHGRSWSEKRYEIPIRPMDIDYETPYKGELPLFWNVGRPVIREGSLYVSVHKVGYDANGYYFYRSEGVLLKSDDILHIGDPAEASWITLPDGNAGLRTPPGGGLVAEEHSHAVLSDGSLYSTYRTTDGHPACAYSRDGGHTWSTPRYVHYEDGRVMRHPRAANFIWKCQNGKYLYWYHNNYGKWFSDRNPAWLCCGEEVPSPEGPVIAWGQPEIVLYDDDPFIRISYPDFIEDGGRRYISETQKDIARIHRLDDAFVEGLFAQRSNGQAVRDGLILDCYKDEGITDPMAMPALGPLLEMDPEILDRRTKDFRRGFTAEAVFEAGEMADRILLDNRDESGKGFSLRLRESGVIEITLDDGRTRCSWTGDEGMLKAHTRHHVSVVVDGGPKIILFIIDGKLCDGGGRRQFGWGRYNPNLRTIRGADTLTPGSGDVTLYRVRLYERQLTTSECMGNWRSTL